MQKITKYKEEEDYLSFKLAPLSILRIFMLFFAIFVGFLGIIFLYTATFESFSFIGLIFTFLGGIGSFLGIYLIYLSFYNAILEISPLHLEFKKRFWLLTYQSYKIPLREIVAWNGNGFEDKYQLKFITKENTTIRIPNVGSSDKEHICKQFESIKKNYDDHHLEAIQQLNISTSKQEESQN